MSGSKDSTAFKVLYDLPLMTIQKRLTGIRKSFKNIAFVGPNPYFFLQHLPKNYEVEKFYFIENDQSSVEQSYKMISSKIETGFYEK